MANTGTARTKTALPRTAPRRVKKDRAGRLVFLREFLRRPGQLGTCFTSSKPLARKMVEGLGIERARNVVELGPGPGPVTAEILSRLPAGARFLAIEQNPALAAVLRERFPGLRIAIDDAANIERLCRRAGIAPGAVDCIVSGVPFLLLEPPAQRRLLAAIAAVLKPGGMFSQVTYGAEGLMPKARRFRALLESLFPHVRRIGPVLTNVPPAFVYKCRT